MFRIKKFRVSKKKLFSPGYFYVTEFDVNNNYLWSLLITAVRY